MAQTWPFGTCPELSVPLFHSVPDGVQRRNCWPWLSARLGVKSGAATLRAAPRRSHCANKLVLTERRSAVGLPLFPLAAGA